MVSGGPTIQENQRITPELIDEIESHTAFAPLHTPIAVYIMREALRLFPGVPNFAVLDTCFHRTMPDLAKQMPIPAEYSAMGVRRYGYHGISYESIVYQLQPNVPEKLIVAHLGNGASISAIRNGQCLDTSMGLTPTGGIISGYPHRRHRSRRAAVHPAQDRGKDPERATPRRINWKSRSPRRPACWA